MRTLSSGPRRSSGPAGRPRSPRLLIATTDGLPRDLARGALASLEVVGGRDALAAPP